MPPSPVPLLALLLVCLWPALVSAADRVLRVDRAEFVVAAGERPPPDDAGWAAVALPDPWDRRKPRLSGEGWYRFRFDALPAPGERWGLYLPRAGNALEIRFNGTEVLRLGIDSDPHADWSRRPIHVSLPDGVLRSGANEVHIRLQVQPGRGGGLSALQVGPDAEVSSRHAWRQAMTVWSTLGVASVIGALGLVALALWARLRDEVYLYFGAGSLLWAVRLGATLAVEPPITSEATWEALLSTLYGAYIGMMALFALTVLDLRVPRVRALVVAYLWLNPVACALAQWPPLMVLQPAWHAVHVAVASAVGLTVLVRAVRRPSVEAVLLAGGIAASVAAGVHDWVQYWARNDGYEAVRIARHVSLVFFATMTWILVDRFTRALRGHARLNAELEDRIAAAQREIDRQYALLREADRAATRQAERERIVRDLHDGIGGQLVLLAQRARDADTPQSEIAAQLSDVMLQMRLSIESLDTPDGDLGSALANVRYRFGERLRAVGIDVRWRIEDLPLLPALNASGVLDVQRILLEAMTNAMRHGGARRLEVDVVRRDAAVVLSVVDDGRGFDAAAVAGGRGLTNMRHRARGLGAELEIESGPAGTRLTLRLPVSAVPSTTDPPSAQEMTS